MTAEGERWAPRLQAALVVPAGGGEVSDEAREKAQSFVKRARLLMGTGIDPAAVLNALEGFSEALKLDPGCIDAYLGLGRAAMSLAKKRPSEAIELLGPTLRWVARSSNTVGKLQESQEIHALEIRLREARRDAQGRPQAKGETVRVQLERDEEGRVIRDGRRVSFLTDSGELLALVPGMPVPPEETGQRIPAWIPLMAAVLLVVAMVNINAGRWDPMVNGLIVGAGLVVLSLPVLVWSGRYTKGVAPGVIAVTTFALSIIGVDHLQARKPPPAVSATRFDERLGPLYASLRPLLRVGSPRAPAFALSKLAVVEETGIQQHPLQTDALHDQLPGSLRAHTPKEVRYVVVVRRMKGKAQDMLFLWVLDPNDRLVLARTAFSGEPRALEGLALDWLMRLRQ